MVLSNTLEWWVFVADEILASAKAMTISTLMKLDELNASRVTFSVTFSHALYVYICASFQFQFIHSVRLYSKLHKCNMHITQNVKD